MTLFDEPKPFTFKTPSPTPVDNPSLTILRYTCNRCQRIGTYRSDTDFSRTCECGQLTVNPTPDGKHLEYHYSMPLNWLDTSEG